ncbi:hypothetical protein Agub_g6263, partial [Astrephomene gubernaculifera]
LPAGLVEAGDSCEQTALRELREETGFSGRVLSISPPLAESAGMTNCCCRLALVEVDGDAPENADPRVTSCPDTAGGEILHCELLPYNGLLPALMQLRNRYGNAGLEHSSSSHASSSSPPDHPCSSSSGGKGGKGENSCGGGGGGGGDNGVCDAATARCIVDSRLYALALALALQQQLQYGEGEEG